MTGANKSVCGLWSVVRVIEPIAVAQSGVAEPKCVVILQKQGDTGRPKAALGRNGYAHPKIIDLQAMQQQAVQQCMGMKASDHEHTLRITHARCRRKLIMCCFG